jgi:hypothetical protein
VSEQKEAEIIIRTFGIYGIEMGPRLHSGDTTINAKTTPRIVNRPCGSRHSVIPRRLRDAFVIMGSFFAELLSVALDTANWYQERHMSTRCWWMRELEKYKQINEIMAEEITIIILNGGILTLNPNEDWIAEGHEGIHPPIAITTGVLTLLISRAQALRWLNDSERGAEASVKVITKIHMPEQSEVKRIKMRELGTRASHFCRKKTRNGGYMSVQMAERMASYANSGIGDQPFLNEPVVMLFQQGKASRAAQKLQMSQLTKQDLSLYALEEMPKEPKDYYSNVLPAREIIEDPDVCHDKGAKSIVEIVENLPIGKYRMREWSEIAGTDEIPCGRIVEETPDEPLQAISVGWHPELMNLTVAGAYKPLESNDLDSSSYGPKAKAERKMWFALRKVVINILRHWGVHIPERGEAHQHGSYVDSGGWTRLGIILERVNGEALERAANQMQAAFDRNRSVEDHHGAHYTCALPKKSRRDWNFAVEDIIRMAIYGDVDRFQIMRAVCPATGVAVPRWMRARQGRTLRFIDPMRTSLRLFQMDLEEGDPSTSETEPYRCDMLDYIGEAVHYTDRRAVRNILFLGLRNDNLQHTGCKRRAAITPDPFGPGDTCDNAQSQRLLGNAHVSIDVHYWWKWYGMKATGKIRVRLFAILAGTLIFKNVNVALSTVISTKCFARVLMRYNIYQYGGDENVDRRKIPGCGIERCEVWQGNLVDHCNPPDDQMVDGAIYTYVLMATFYEIPTPQLGLTAPDSPMECLANRTPWIVNSESMIDRQIADIIRNYPDECTEYRHEAEKRVDGSRNSFSRKPNITTEVLCRIPLGIFLRAKAVFICRPHCYFKKGLIEPIRVGQFLCLNDGCRREIKWTARGDAKIRVDSLSARANLYQDSIDRGRRPTNMGKYILPSRCRRAFTQPTRKHRIRWDTKKVSSDETGLTHGLVWSAAGGIWLYPRPYQVCPWNSDETEYPEYQWGDLFPLNFVLKLRQFMREPDRAKFNIHKTGYYYAIWMGMQNSIKRDPALRGDPKIQDYVKKVIKNAQWCRNIGQFEDHDKHVINDSNSFRMDSRLEDSMSTTMVQRGSSSQPQAIGSQKMSKVGRNITPSLQEHKKVFDPRTAIDDANEPEYAASSSSVGSKKRAARRGRGASKAKVDAQMTQTDRPNESPTTRTTRTRDTTPQRLIVSMPPCRDVRETEQERREEITRAQRTGGRPIAPDNAMDDTNVEAGDAGGGQTPSEQDHEERRHPPWRRARQGGRHWGPYAPTQRTYVRTTPAAGTWLLNFNELYYAYAVVGPWRRCGGMNPSYERWELLQVSMGLPYTP